MLYEVITSNEINDIKEVVKEILKIEFEDGVKFEIESVDIKVRCTMGKQKERQDEALDTTHMGLSHLT